MWERPTVKLNSTFNKVGGLTKWNIIAYRLIGLFLILAIPMHWLGGQIASKTRVYQTVVGLAIFFMIFEFNKNLTLKRLKFI
jgi:uncharacterized membrane protein YuzA (DUF378 family)